MNSGEEYENDLFVGDVHRGNLYHFECLTRGEQLASFQEESLKDGIVDGYEEEKDSNIWTRL